MQSYDGEARPQIRPIEAHAVQDNGQPQYVLVDPTGWADASLTVNGEALFLLGMFDGEHCLDDMRVHYEAQFGQAMPTETLTGIVDGLRQARFLGGADFVSYYRELQDEYRSTPTRPILYAEAFESGDDLRRDITEMLASNPVARKTTGQIRGIVAPHLDYPRGGVCYAVAYGLLAELPSPKRVIVLGTNHFGLSTAVTVTGKAFESPLGVTQVDTGFVEELEQRCGDLRAYELDHAREHSVELQVLICQHIWRADSFEIVPVLCPDPCGPTGTAPLSGEGVDLADFGEALRDCVAGDIDGTLIIAGADLSHFGREFGDERDLDAAFCSEVKHRDKRALEHLSANRCGEFIASVSLEDNPTRVCSAGCISTAMRALDASKVELLHYHQAVDAEQHTGVSCAAAVFLD